MIYAQQGVTYSKISDDFKQFEFFSFLSTNRKLCSQNGFQTSNRHNSGMGCPTETKFCKINCGYHQPLIVQFHQIAAILKISCFLKKLKKKIFYFFIHFELFKFLEVKFINISSEIDSSCQTLPRIYTTYENLNSRRCFSAHRKRSFLQVYFYICLKLSNSGRGSSIGMKFWKINIGHYVLLIPH